MVEIWPSVDSLAGGVDRAELALSWASDPAPDDHLAAGFFTAAALRIRRPYQDAWFHTAPAEHLEVTSGGDRVTVRMVSPSGGHALDITAELLGGRWLVSDLAIEALT